MKAGEALRGRRGGGEEGRGRGGEHRRTVHFRKP